MNPGDFVLIKRTYYSRSPQEFTGMLIESPPYHPPLVRKTIKIKLLLPTGKLLEFYLYDDWEVEVLSRVKLVGE